MKILVVEDERDLNRIITKHLKKNNYSVDSCFDGEEALDFVSYSEYDLIITDIMMPNVDGYEFIARLRESKNNTPVIMLTAKDTLEDKIVGLDSGADDYIVKAETNPSDIVKRIKEAVSNKTCENEPIYVTPGLNIFKMKNPYIEWAPDIEISVNIKI